MSDPRAFAVVAGPWNDYANPLCPDPLPAELKLPLEHLRDGSEAEHVFIDPNEPHLYTNEGTRIRWTLERTGEELTVQKYMSPVLFANCAPQEEAQVPKSACLVATGPSFQAPTLLICKEADPKKIWRLYTFWLTDTSPKLADLPIVRRTGDVREPKTMFMSKFVGRRRRTRFKRIISKESWNGEGEEDWAPELEDKLVGKAMVKVGKPTAKKRRVGPEPAAMSDVVEVDSSVRRSSARERSCRVEPKTNLEFDRDDEADGLLEQFRSQSIATENNASRIMALASATADRAESPSGSLRTVSPHEVEAGASDVDETARLIHQPQLAGPTNEEDTDVVISKQEPGMFVQVKAEAEGMEMDNVADIHRQPEIIDLISDDDDEQDEAVRVKKEIIDGLHQTQDQGVDSNHQVQTAPTAEADVKPRPCDEGPENSHTKVWFYDGKTQIPGYVRLSKMLTAQKLFAYSAAKFRRSRDGGIMVLGVRVGGEDHESVIQGESETFDVWMKAMSDLKCVDIDGQDGEVYHMNCNVELRLL